MQLRSQNSASIPTETRTASPAAAPLALQCFTYDYRDLVLPDLLHALQRNGAWFCDRSTTPTPNSVELHLEVAPNSVMDIYATLILSNIELTRDTHLALTDCCTCIAQQPPSHTAGQPLTLHITLTFLNLRSLAPIFETSPDANA